MSADEPVATGPLRFALEGQGFRRALALIEGESTRLATALRRALPFLARREVPITLAWARALPMSDALRDLPRPFHVSALTVEPGRAPGALVLDTNALRLLLDGVLGGDGRALPTLDAAGLTAPQRALVGRTVEGIVRAVGEVLSSRIGVNLALASDRPDPNGSDGTSIVCAFSLGADLGRVLLVLPKNALLGPGAAVTSETPGPGDVQPARAARPRRGRPRAGGRARPGAHAPRRGARAEGRRHAPLGRRRERAGERAHRRQADVSREADHRRGLHRRPHRVTGTIVD